VRGLALTHLGIVLCIGLSYLITDRLPFVFTYLLSSTMVSADAVLTCQFALACLTVLPSTFLMGAIFPITVRVVTGDLATVGRDVGFAYALNTVGAIVGSFFSGFVILPGLGSATRDLSGRCRRPGAGRACCSPSHRTCRARAG
jgi:hypothetical protein